MELLRVTSFKLVWWAQLIPKTIAGEARLLKLPGEHVVRTRGVRGITESWMVSGYQSLIEMYASEASAWSVMSIDNICLSILTLFVSIDDQVSPLVTQHFNIFSLIRNLVLFDLDLCYLHWDDFVNLYRNLMGVVS